MQASSSERSELQAVDLRGLDRLMVEVRELSGAPGQTPRLVHALRNLAHVATLLADVLKDEGRTPGSARDRGDARSGSGGGE